MDVEERRGRLRERLIEIAEARIRAEGFAALKARDLAREAGCALGAIYNVFDDLDALVLAVKARTLTAIDRAVAQAAAPDGSAAARLESIGLAYLDFAVTHPRLWRCLFEHRLPADAEVPGWYADQLSDLFRHLMVPLAALFPDRPEQERREMSQALFTAVHGIVALGLEGRPGAATREQIADRIRFVVGGALRGAARGAERLYLSE